MDADRLCCHLYLCLRHHTRPRIEISFVGNIIPKMYPCGASRVTESHSDFFISYVKTTPYDRAKRRIYCRAPTTTISQGTKKSNRVLMGVVRVHGAEVGLNYDEDHKHSMKIPATFTSLFR